LAFIIGAKNPGGKASPFLAAELVLILLEAFFLYKCNLGPLNGF